jgi:ribonuclease HI
MPGRKLRSATNIVERREGGFKQIPGPDGIRLAWFWQGGRFRVIGCGDRDFGYQTFERVGGDQFGTRSGRSEFVAVVIMALSDSHSKYARSSPAERHHRLRALEHALPLGGQHLELFSDSELLVEQMNGNYKVKNAGLLPLHREARHLCSQFAASAVYEFSHLWSHSPSNRRRRSSLRESRKSFTYEVKSVTTAPTSRNGLISSFFLLILHFLRLPWTAPATWSKLA